MTTVGQLFILSAPSGAGKTTLLKRVMAIAQGLSFSISHTTRSPRSGETDGVDYHFVSVGEFQKMRDENLFLEWAEVHENYYGTSKLEIVKKLDQGFDIILDIDVQGAAIILREKLVPAVSVFIAPPSLPELEKRLRGRGTDSDETIALRLHNAATEMEAASDYRYLVINDHVEDAADTLLAVIVAERSRNRRLPTGEPVDLSLFRHLS